MKNLKIAYCLPALYSMGGMERVLVMKANYFAQRGYEVHIIITDGGDKPSYFTLDNSVVVHQLNIDFEEVNSHSFLRRFLLYKKKIRLFKYSLN